MLNTEPDTIMQTLRAHEAALQQGGVAGWPSSGRWRAAAPLYSAMLKNEIAVEKSPVLVYTPAAHPTTSLPLPQPHHR